MVSLYSLYFMRMWTYERLKARVEYINEQLRARGLEPISVEFYPDSKEVDINLPSGETLYAYEDDGVVAYEHVTEMHMYLMGIESVLGLIG